MEDKLITYYVDTTFKALLLIYGCVGKDNKRYILRHKYEDNGEIEHFAEDNRIYIVYDVMAHVTCRSYKIQAIRKDRHGRQKLSNGMIKCNRTYDDFIIAIRYD